MHPLLTKYKSHFPDIASLYDYQEEVIKMLLNKKNSLAIIPTGGGKSLLYQLLSLELEGITLVISPLLALMEEQVTELNVFRKINSLALNSKIPFVKQREILRNLASTSYKLIYVSPERLQNPFFRAALISSGVKVSMIVIDEAHCISQWGSSFRPEYGQINGFVDFLKVNNQLPFLLCLTATLSQIARKDVATEFDVAIENIYVTPKIIRNNLKLHFQKVDNEDEKPEYLKSFLTEYKPNKTIAYLYSKYLCETYTDLFSDDYSTDYYHADVDGEEKTNVYEKFLNNEIDILFATTAFGMGINIPDIESVVHIQIPHSIEEYYQHVGRGWRKKSIDKDCHCFAMWSEKNFKERFRDLKNQKFTPEYLLEVYKSLLGAAKIKVIGQIVNKDKNAIMSSADNLQLLRYKLEKHGVIKTIGEINGSPLDIEFYINTPLWEKVVATAKNGIDSFGYVSKELNLDLNEIITHLYEQDLVNNIKKLPATKRDIYFEVSCLELSDEVVENIINEINDEVDFRIAQLNELKEFFLTDDVDEFLNKALK